MKVLVTGGSGFVGRVVVNELLAAGHQVRLTLRRPDQTAIPGVERVQIGDLEDPIDWMQPLDGMDGLVHVAGLAHQGKDVSEQRLFAVNATATERLMRAAARAGTARVVHVSSLRAIVGSSCDRLVEEDHTPVPTNAYGRSKLAAEAATLGAGLSGVILRLPVVHGAGVRANMRALARLAALPVPLPLGGLTARRSIISDRNVAAAVRHALTLGNTDMFTALVADPRPLNVSEMIGIFRRAIGRPAMLIGAPRMMSLLSGAIGQRDRWETLTGRLELSCRRLAETGWRPPEDSEAGLARTIRALR